MTPKTVLITGCNRGIGYEFVNQFAQQGWRVIACSRHPEVLQELHTQYSNITPLYLDLNQLDSLQDALAEIADEPIDILINNAGVYGPSKLDIHSPIDAKSFHDVYQINSIAPLLLTQNLLKNLNRAQTKVIVNITSRMGSISDNDSGGSYIYRSSKAALNAIMKSLQIDLKPEGYKVLLLHPGWVKTDMGGAHAQTTIEASVTKMMALILKAQDLPELFYHFEGDVLPW